MPEKVLIIEDDLSIANLERRYLEKAGFEVSVAGSGLEALDKLSADGLPDLLIIDLNLPDMSGIDVMKGVREAGRDIPSVIVTGAGDAKVAVSAMKLGALDYIVKDIEAIKALPRTCSDVLRKFRLARENANLMEELKRVNSDLTEANRRLGELSVRDELTGVYNRRHLTESLDHEILKARRHGMPLSLALFDLDRFKAINDAFGHPVGDVVLRQFAIALAGRLRRTDILCRYGGEEFAVALTGTSLESAVRVCDELRELVAARSFGSEDRPLRITASAGVAGLTPEMDALKLIEVADRSLYLAKESGRNRVAAIQVGKGAPQGDSETKRPVER